MIYCMRCGMLNPEGSLNCSNCGAPLVTQKAETRPYNRYKNYRSPNPPTHRSDRSHMGLIIMSIILIITALATLRNSAGFGAYFWPIALLLIGVWVLILGLQRSRRYKQPSTI